MAPAVAFIGLGIMAHRMLTNMTRTGGFRLAGGWDPDPEACRRAAAAFDGLAIAGSAEALIGDPASEIVYIASPPATHAAHATAAAEAGKLVLCEKPLGIDLAGSRALVEALEAKEARACVNFPFAEAAVVDAIAGALKDGRLGTPEAVDVRLHFAKWPRDWQEGAAWLTRREQGGFTRETFSHYAFLAQRLFGPARLIDAAVRYPDDGVGAETQVTALIDCGGVLVSFAGGVGGPDFNAADRVELTVWGSRAVYRLYDWNGLTIHEGDGWVEQLTDIPDRRQDGYRRMLENLGRFQRGEPNSMPSLREALAVQELVEAILAGGR